ncbi:hypothetical protein [Clostridium rectalis]|uniref:hypothetical protein n=1 Tax=Clostridium rectalis TaxID=2040295 RepID=UPI000F644E76|nr:hypothetical protein [Clostridium rectalis]
MKYIGPFLRLNSLNKENIESQLFYFSKESLNHIVFNSKCGLTIPGKELKQKSYSDSEVNLLKSMYPILCVYKKANSKLKTTNDKLYWNDEKFKKEITVYSNAFMTLSLLELCDYYSSFKELDKSKYFFSDIYLNLSKKQLQFYATYLRNLDGVFVDKINSSDSIVGELKLEDKNKKFKFSNQSFMMSAFYKCSLKDNSKESSNYKNFSLDILNMFLQFRDELYTLPLDELLQLCMGLNIFYKYSQNEDCKNLMIDISELIIEKYSNNLDILGERNLENKCLYYIDLFMLYENTKILKYRDVYNKVYTEILDSYNDELGIYIKPSEKDNLIFSATELSLYILSVILHCKEDKDDIHSRSILTSVFKKQIIDSGIILSWPDAPPLNDRERYRNFSLNSEDLLEEEFFKSQSLPTPESSEQAPIFIKNIKFSEKKQLFKQGKTSFYSNNNMFIFFLNIFLYNSYH